MVWSASALWRFLLGVSMGDSMRLRADAKVVIFQWSALPSVPRFAKPNTRQPCSSPADTSDCGSGRGADRQRNNWCERKRSSKDREKRYIL
jgi:hypothetical protein